MKIIQKQVTEWHADDHGWPVQVETRSFHRVRLPLGVEAFTNQPQPAGTLVRSGERLLVTQERALLPGPAQIPGVIVGTLDSGS